MKNTIVLLSLIALFASCSKLDKLGTFSTSRSGEFTIPATATFGTPIVWTSNVITSDYKAELENNGLSTDNVEYMKITKMVVKIKTPAGTNFNFLQDMKISISADGLADQELASKLNVQNDNVSEMEIDVTGADVKPYLTKDNFTMKGTATNDEPILQDIVIEAVGTFEVKGKLK